MDKEETDKIDEKAEIKTERENINESIDRVKQDEEVLNLKKELEETTDRMKRIMAEFENYKKRNAKERTILYNSLLSDIILSFLPIIDNLEKAVITETKDEVYKKGVELVLKQFIDTFKMLGVETIETVGKTFDPEVHDAVTNIIDDTLGEKEIKQELRKGYKIGTKVIRHAMVVVAN